MPRQMTASTLDQDVRADQDAQTDFGEWPEAVDVTGDADTDMFARSGIAEAEHQVLVDDDLDDEDDADDDDIDDEDDADDEDVEGDSEEGGERSAADPDDDAPKDEDEDDDDFDDDDAEDDEDDEKEDE